ncbi:MAG: phosphodiester glycosidase family protein [bacterium]
MRRVMVFCNKVVFGAVVLCLSARAAAGATLHVTDAWEKQIHPGVTYRHYKGYIDSFPVHVYAVEIHLNGDAVRIRPALANDTIGSLETVPSMAKRYDALAAVNGSFFNRKEESPYPVGFLMMDGNPVFFSHRNRSAFGVTRAGDVVFGYPRARGIVYVEDSGRYFQVWSMNNPRRENEVVVYTPEHGDRTRTNEYGREVVVEKNKVKELRAGNSPLPHDGYVISMHGKSREYVNLFREGANLRLYFVVDDEWVAVENAVTGGPLLLKDGNLAVGSVYTEELKNGYRSRIPQTAVASAGRGHLLLVVVDGRNKRHSIGLTYTELAEFLMRTGAVNAVGMDGGGSSTMVINGEVVNKPSDGKPRRVNNAILVLKKP